MSKSTNTGGRNWQKGERNLRVSDKNSTLRVVLAETRLKVDRRPQVHYPTQACRKKIFRRSARGSFSELLQLCNARAAQFSHFPFSAVRGEKYVGFGDFDFHLF